MNSKLFALVLSTCISAGAHAHGSVSYNEDASIHNNTSNKNRNTNNNVSNNHNRNTNTNNIHSTNTNNIHNNNRNTSTNLNYNKTQSSANANANANSNSNSNATSVAAGGSSKSISQGGSAVGVGSQGQSLAVNNTIASQAPPRNPVSSASAPPLTSSNDTCMGSTSIGGSAVSFGFSAGTTWTDDNCVMLKNARELWNMGFKGAALTRLCMDDKNREALESSGVICPPRGNGKSRETQSVAEARRVMDNSRN